MRDKRVDVTTNPSTLRLSYNSQHSTKNLQTPSRINLLGQNPTKSEAMRVRVLASGSGPTPAPMLSSRCCGLFVAGMTHVTAGCDTIHFNKNCAHEWQSNSAAHAGSGFAEIT